MKEEKNNKSVEAVPYSDDEVAARSGIIADLNFSLQQRQQNYTELDDMTYDMWYIENKKAASGYVAPRANAYDVRTNSGVVRDKSLSLLSNLLDYNFEPDVEAYDEDGFVDREFGKLSEDMIKKSRKIDYYDRKRELIYKELCDQGNVFVWERFVVPTEIRKDLTKFDVKKISNTKWKEEVVTGQGECSSEMVSGLNVYLGNIREFYVQKQPFIGIRFERTRAEAQSIYGEWERWKYVPYKIQKVTNDQGARTYEDWSMIECKADMVEELHYFNRWTNTYQVMVNGVCMLPVGFPMSHQLGIIDYPISKGDGEPISPHFAYCRSIPSKNKFNQQLVDEMYRAMILKTRQSYKPPMADNTGLNLTEKIFYPGTIHQNIPEDKLKPIVSTTGVTSSEMAMMNFVKQVVDEASVSPIFEGNSPQRGQPLGQTQLQQKQTMIKIGVIILGVILLEHDMAWLRLYNIARNWTGKVKSQLRELPDGTLEWQDKYRSVSMDTEMDDNSEGQRVVEFSKNIPTDSQVNAEAELLSEIRGYKIKKTYVDPDIYRKLRHKFYIEIIPEEKETSELRKTMFKQGAFMLMQAFPELVNREYIAKRIALNEKLDPDKALKLQQAQQPMMGGGIQQPSQQTSGGEGMPMQGIAAQVGVKAPAQPSLNSLTNANS